MSTRAWKRSLVLLLPVALLLGILCMPADAKGTRHPYFNDRGTLTWYHSLAEAQSVARRANKVIFIEYGRKKCSNCKKLAQMVLPHRDIRGRMQSAAIGLAADCDRPERAVYQLFKTHMPKARTLPFAAFITPEGQWITGWYGGRTVDTVSGHLSVAESHVRAMRAPVRGRSSERSVRMPASTPRRPERTAPIAQKPQRRVYPAPPPPEEGRTDNGECEDGGTGSECVGGNCKPPSFECKPLLDLPNPLKLLAGNCKPQPCPPQPCPPQPCPPKPVCPPEPTVEPTPLPPPAPERTVARKTDGFGNFPPPAARVPEPKKLLADNSIPAAVPPTAIGSPDGVPSRKSKPSVPTARATPDVEDLAKEAAAKGDWATVLRLTRDAAAGQRYLLALNREAHAWAHSRLAYAVVATRRGRFSEAQHNVSLVQQAMRGEAEAVDAERGVEAIELMRDLEPLAEKSPVRTNVRKTAYEKMRGTRWAPLFSPVPQPSAALSSR